MIDLQLIELGKSWGHTLNVAHKLTKITYN